MQDIKDRVMSLFYASGLKGIRVQFEPYIEKINTELSQTYYYNVDIPEVYCIDKYDRWNTSKLEGKVIKFNDLAKERVKFTKVNLSIQECPYKTVIATLSIEFPINS